MRKIVNDRSTSEIVNDGSFACTYNILSDRSYVWMLDEVPPESVLFKLRNPLVTQLDQCAGRTYFEYLREKRKSLDGIMNLRNKDKVAIGSAAFLGLLCWTLGAHNLVYLWMPLALLAYWFRRQINHFLSQ